MEVGSASVGGFRMAVQEEETSAYCGVVAVEGAVGEEEVERGEGVDIGFERAETSMS